MFCRGRECWGWEYIVQVENVGGAGIYSLVVVDVRIINVL